ncbi:MAG: endonuclease domain-containing protein [Thermoanaerobaculia bacterium]
MNEKAPHEWQTDSALWGRLKETIRTFRSHPTESEALLWNELRSRRFHGVRFRRQHSVGPFVLDFYCWKRNLAIELDGPIHERSRERDTARDQYLLSRGITVPRIKNTELSTSMSAVLARIEQALNLPSPPEVGTEG